MHQESRSHINPVQLHLLVLRCQAGDEQAFFDLYHIYKEPTHRYLNGLLDAGTAEDVHQEVWLTVYQKIRNLANPKAFRTWLYQTTRFRAIDYLRKEQRESALLDNFKEETEQPHIYEEEPLIEKDHSQLLEAMERLSPKHRDVLMLLYWEQMSYEEIALIVGSPVGTIRSRIYQAKDKLKQTLEEHHND